MKRPPYFTHLTGSAGLWQPDTPGFARLAASSLGDAGSAADHTEASIASLFNALDAAGRLSEAITRAGLDLQQSVMLADSIRLGDLDAAIAAAASAGGPSLAHAAGALSLLDAAGSWVSALPAAPAEPVPTVATEGAPAGGGVGGALAGPVDSVILSTGAMATVTALHTAALIGTVAFHALSIAIPIVGAAVAVVLLALHFIGHGCGAPCIEGSKAEQIYEAGSDNLLALYKLGMITAVQAMAGMAYFLSAGTRHLESFGTQAANRGITNMTNTIHAEMHDIDANPKPKPQPFNLAAAHLRYVSGPGWYPDSLTAAANLTDTYVEQALALLKG